MKLSWKKLLVFFGVIGIIVALNGFGYSEMKKSFKEREEYILTQNRVLRSKLAVARSENEKIKKQIEEDYKEVILPDGTKTIERKTTSNIEIEKELRETIEKEFEDKYRVVNKRIRDKMVKEYIKKNGLILTGGVFIDTNFQTGYMGNMSYITPWNPFSISAGAMSDGRFTFGIGISL